MRNPTGRKLVIAALATASVRAMNFEGWDDARLIDDLADAFGVRAFEDVADAVAAADLDPADYAVVYGVSPDCVPWHPTDLLDNALDYAAG